MTFTTPVIHEKVQTNTPLNLAGRIPELDGIRGIAIALVLFWHFFYLPSTVTPATPLSYALVLGRLTWSGVDLFFVLSGFLIGGILIDARASTLLVVTRWSHHSGFTWLTAAALPWYPYWTFTQNFWMAHSATLGANILGITWSLAIEEQFYITLPLIVRFFTGRRLIAFVITGICLAPLLRIAIHHFSPDNWVAAFVLMPCRADALLLGVLAAIVLRDNRWRESLSRNNHLFLSLFSVLLIGTAFLTLRSPNPANLLMKSVGYTWLALFYATVLVFALTRRNSILSKFLRSTSLGWLGTIAYGTYLLHQAILGILFGYFWRHDPRITGGYTLLTAVLALVLALVIARLSWRFFEQPLIRFGHRSSYVFADSETRGSTHSTPELASS